MKAVVLKEFVGPENLSLDEIPNPRGNTGLEPHHRQRTVLLMMHEARGQLDHAMGRTPVAGSGRPHRITTYRVGTAEYGRLFLDPQEALFALHEQGSYTPPDWHLQMLKGRARV
jgi:hypothetical protein